MKKRSTFIAMAIMLMTMQSLAQLMDIDRNWYKTVSIGFQDWTAENLTVGHFKNGDIITEVRSNDEWQKAAADHKPVCCYYNDFSGYGRTYGKLYNWYALNDPRGLAPEGWHVPTDFQWRELVAQLGSDDVARSKLKSSFGWGDDSNGTNESGLSFLPGGYRNLDGTFNEIGGDGFWWSSSESDNEHARSFTLNDLYRNNSAKGLGYAVRCLKD